MTSHIIPHSDCTSLDIAAVNAISFHHYAVLSHALASECLASDRQESLGSNDVAHFHFPLFVVSLVRPRHVSNDIIDRPPVNPSSLHFPKIILSRNFVPVRRSPAIPLATTIPPLRRCNPAIP